MFVFSLFVRKKVFSLPPILVNADISDVQHTILKSLTILENFAEIHLEHFAEICLKFFAEISMTVNTLLAGHYRIFAYAGELCIGRKCLLCTLFDSIGETTKCDSLGGIEK